MAKLCLLPYYGGKSRSLNWLYSHFPEHSQYECFVDVFGGAGNVVLNHPHKKKVEVYNDINSNVVNLFRVLRDKDKAKQLQNLLQLTPFSREEKYYCWDDYTNKDFTDVERARMYVIVIKQGFFGHESKDWGITMGEDRNGAETFNNYWKSLDVVIDRIKQLNIENNDFSRILKVYDKPHCFLYCDPPYLAEAKICQKKRYIHEMEFEQHEKLLELCLKSKALVMISGYDSELYNTALKDWKKETILKSQATKRGKNKTQGTETFAATECIWMNYSKPSLF